jgi:hypothetical protein
MQQIHNDKEIGFGPMTEMPATITDTVSDNVHDHFDLKLNAIGERHARHSLANS